MLRNVLPVDREHALHTSASTRSIELAAQASLPPHVLMERAGIAAARLALALAPHASTIWIACGPGNNGGDGLVAARWLQRAGKQVHVSLFARTEHLPGDAAHALQLAQSAGVPIDSDLPDPDRHFDLALDALLGLGVNRPVDGMLGLAIDALNRMDCPVLALDLPSGLDTDTGHVHGAHWVRAQHTLALLTLKPGLFTGAGREAAGAIWFDELGVQADAAPDVHLLGASSWVEWARPRRHGQHKGSFGDVMVIGGAPGMAGAALLAARAAHAAGAGRIYLSLLGGQTMQGADPVRPELMSMHWQKALEPAQLDARTVVCGCGGGDAVAQVLPSLLHFCPRLVLDADGLNAVASDPQLQTLLARRARRHLHTVITPHPLEAARLLGWTSAQVQSDRLAAARSLCQRYDCTVLLKGSGSLLLAPGRLPAINSSGSAALATAGSGDVLAGCLAGLWAQRPQCEAIDAAAAACYWHASLADASGRAMVRAADLIELMARRQH
jgi:hydroxyethylthiazole kinase-like uncharacterized protein yjeF